MKGFQLYNGKRKGVKLRSVDLVFPLRFLLEEIDDLRSDTPSRFLMRAVSEVAQLFKIDYVVDSGFLNLKAGGAREDNV